MTCKGTLEHTVLLPIWMIYLTNISALKGLEALARACNKNNNN